MQERRDKHRKDVKEFTPKRGSDIVFTLDSYDDLFSDFDPRRYSERGLSVDFLDEANRALIDRPQNVSINFFLPIKARDESVEKTIKKRMKAHSLKHYQILKEEKKKIVKQGIGYTGVGLVFMLIVTFFLYKNAHNSIALFLTVLLEPGSWFLFWEGLDMLVFEKNKKNTELKFYKRMSVADINFFSRK